MEHVEIPAGEIHKAHNWEFADAAERAAEVVTDATLIGRLALQLDTNELYVLTGTSPAAWTAIKVSTSSVTGLESLILAYAIALGG